MNWARRLAFLAATAVVTAGLAVLVHDSLRGSLSVRPVPVEQSPPAPPQRTARLVELRGGGTRDLSQAPGKLLLLHFWATWCPPCVDELPGVLAYARRIRKDPDVELLAVSVDDGWKTVDDWLRERGGLDLPVALDPQGNTAAAFGTEKFPETYVLSPTGQTLLYVRGPADWRSPEFLRQLETARKAVEAKPAGSAGG